MKSAFECCQPCVPPERHPGCHDHCSKFEKARAKYEKDKEADRSRRGYSSESVYAQTCDAVTRAEKRRRGHKRY